MGTGVYFFSGDEYVRYDRGDDAVSDGPLSIADNWHGMADAEFDAGIDAAINLQAGNVYFFQGDQYVRYNLSQDRVDFGPTAIGAQWPGMAAAGFDSDLDGHSTGATGPRTSSNGTPTSDTGSPLPKGLKQATR